ncbi:MAG: hypothetical protein H6Q72_4284 [Firmicutes bacterium]|nr:hypothetical protein [Bacillota bacterium]
MNREPIYAALFELVQGISGIVTTGRNLKHWADVPAFEQPAIFQRQVNEAANSRTALPTSWVMNAEWYIYCNAEDDSSIATSTQLNAILDAVETALKQDIVTGYQTLGGLVFNCNIDGTVEIYEGLQGNQCMAVVPIKIEVINGG